MHYEVRTKNGYFRGNYGVSYNKKNQPIPLAQAIINAKSHGGKVFLVDGDKEE
jgi:hypothetical protein